MIYRRWGMNYPVASHGVSNECVIFSIAASCGELNPIDFASSFIMIRVIRVICEICGLK